MAWGRGAWELKRGKRQKITGRMWSQNCYRRKCFQRNWFLRVECTKITFHWYGQPNILIETSPKRRDRFLSFLPISNFYFLKVYGTLLSTSLIQLVSGHINHHVKDLLKCYKMDEMSWILFLPQSDFTNNLWNHYHFIRCYVDYSNQWFSVVMCRTPLTKCQSGKKGRTMTD